MTYEPRAPKPWALQQFEDFMGGLVLIFCAIVGVIIYAIVSVVNWVDNGISQWQLRNILSPSNIELVVLYEHKDTALNAMTLKYLPLQHSQKPIFIFKEKRRWKNVIEVYDISSAEPAYSGLPVPQFMLVVVENEDGAVTASSAVFIQAVFKYPNVDEKLTKWLTLHEYEDAEDFKLSNLSDPVRVDDHRYFAETRFVDNEPHFKLSQVKQDEQHASEVSKDRINMRGGKHRIHQQEIQRGLYKNDYEQGNFQTSNNKNGFELDDFDNFLMKHAK